VGGELEWIQPLNYEKKTSIVEIFPSNYTYFAKLPSQSKKDQAKKV